jgi:hypothetical protein
MIIYFNKLIYRMMRSLTSFGMTMSLFMYWDGKQEGYRAQERRKT